MNKSEVYAELLRTYHYPPLDDTITLYASGLIVVKFGEVTTNDMDNNAETAWVKSCLEEMKQVLPQSELRVLMDFRTIDSGEFNTKESNQQYREMLHDPRIVKVAVFGLPSGWLLVIDLLRAFMPHKLKVLGSETESIDWLFKPEA